MGPTGNDQQAAGAGVPADNPPAAMPGQVVSPGGATSQSSDGVLTISHNDTPSVAAPAAPATSAAPVVPADPAATGVPSPEDEDLANVDFDPNQPTALDSTPTGEPIVQSAPEPADSTLPPPAPADPNAGAPGAAPQQ